ncbi:MAG TPA: transglycosylase SLT domain-containing protein, partial [Steroidobacteraceae bacterium]|nr:transglycosylase SLT domain-containing protein [Steroidobacteraceae bacterium]
MTTQRLSAPRHTLLALALLALAGCAHSPARTPAPAASAQVPPHAAAPLTPTPPPPPSQPAIESSAPEAAAADANANAGAVTPSPAPTQVAGLTPAQYADLFDRMRAGFKLDDGTDRRAIDDQLRWYAANPDYLQRAFGRADLYLYYIVVELERRNMPLEIALLPVVESAFEPYAYSRASAAGLWQFIPG